MKRNVNILVPALYSLLVMFLSTGCEQKTFETGYFDVISFMQAEHIKLANSKGLELKKELQLNGTTEVNILEPADSLAWANELDMFMDCDINKPAFNGQYDVTRLFLDTDSITRVSYTAKKPDMRVQWMHVYYSPQNEPVLFEALLSRSNLLYESKQELSYEPGVGYQIKGHQDVLLLGIDVFEAKGTYITP